MFDYASVRMHRQTSDPLLGLGLPGFDSPTESFAAVESTQDDLSKFKKIATVENH